MKRLRTDTSNPNDRNYVAIDHTDDNNDVIHGQSHQTKTFGTEQILSTFQVHPISHFSKEFPFFRKPNEIGHFSQDFSRKFNNNSSQLKFFCQPRDSHRTNFNLRHGYNNFIKRDEDKKEYLDDLIRWITSHSDAFRVVGSNQSSTETCLSTDFICWRGALTKLACTPYESKDGWKLAVTLFNKTYYMCEYDTDERIQQKKHESEKQKEMSYWGFKFEQYVTAEKRDGQPDIQKPVNSNEAFCSVVRTRLKKHSLVYGGEVDCCEIEKDIKKYIELKTSREIEYPRQLNNFKRFKVIKWWLQSFLIGIEKVVCGFRDDDGVVHRLEDFLTKDCHKYCQDIPNCWEPTVCFNFLDQFLQHIKDIVQVDDPRVVYLFECKPRDVIRCTLLPKDSSYCFLPEWYTETSSQSDCERSCQGNSSQ